MSEYTIEPQQDRSRETQRRILLAVELLLVHKYFEQITVQDIANEAKVSVGAYYRRFKNKDALLPFIYQLYNERFQNWFSAWEVKPDDGIEQRIINSTCVIYDFFVENKGLIRTVHLNSRLHAELMPNIEGANRSHRYTALIKSWINAHDSPFVEGDENKSFWSVAITMLISSAADKVLYKELAPANFSTLDTNAFAIEIGLAVAGYILSKRND